MKTVLITGISRGIGRALTEKFLAEGFEVIGTAYTDTIPPAEHLTVIKLDLASQKSVTNAIKALQKANKKVDMLINNAGVLVDEDDTEVFVDKLRQTLDVNLLGTIAFTQAVLPLMKDGGRIINISSTAGSLALAQKGQSHSPYHYPSYKISKAALNMYTVTLAQQLKPRNITVLAVHPGWVRTDMGGSDADLSPEESAEAIFQTATRKSSTGQFLFKGKTLPW